MNSKLHSNLSGFLVVLWLLGGFLSIYFSKIGHISKEYLAYLWVGYLFVWMCVDLLLGLHFKEFPQFIAVIKYRKNPKTYLCRIIFNLLIITATGYFLWSNSGQP
jgi:EamA domain-containing membrane protein RarD